MKAETRRLPDGWRWTPLGGSHGCAEIFNGSTPSTDDPSFWNGNILWATPADIGRLRSVYLSDTRAKITKRTDRVWRRSPDPSPVDNQPAKDREDERHSHLRTRQHNRKDESRRPSLLPRTGHRGDTRARRQGGHAFHPTCNPVQGGGTALRKRALDVPQHW